MKPNFKNKHFKKFLPTKTSKKQHRITTSIEITAKIEKDTLEQQFSPSSYQKELNTV